MVASFKPVQIYLAVFISFFTTTMAKLWEWFIDHHNNIVMSTVVMINVATIFYILLGIRKRLLEGNEIKRNLKNKDL